MKCGGEYGAGNMGRWYNTRQTRWSDCPCENCELGKSRWIVPQQLIQSSGLVQGVYQIVYRGNVANVVTIIMDN